MLTASHNPSDQNGIKIFLNSGLKLFPEDDQELSQKLREASYRDVHEASPQGTHSDQHMLARNVFREFSQDTINSWIHSPTSDTIIIDSANGAAAEVIQDILAPIAPNAIHTHCDWSSEINHHCGVADLEGLRIITRDLLKSTFADYSALHTLFEEGRRQQDSLKAGQLNCFALIFDGDADRCFRVDYDPFCDEAIVSSGDQLAYWQAQHLIKTHHWEETPQFINTVESDLGVAIAMQNQEWKTEQTAVGDKWILWKAILSDWITTLQQTGEPENLDHQCQQLKDQTSARKVTKLWQTYQENAKRIHLEIPQIPFAIGSEATGHLITTGITASKQRVYLGNGIKSALNSIAALPSPKTPDDYQQLRFPYPAGLEQSFAVYYVDKTLLLNPAFQEQLTAFIQSCFSDYWPEAELHSVFRPEEPGLLYFEISLSKTPKGALFIRNSGTEDKLSLYLRGLPDEHFRSITPIIHHHLLCHTKDPKHPFYSKEQAILAEVSQRQSIPKNLETQNRLIHEMSLKQKLILRDEKQWRLTEAGKAFYEFLNH